MHIDNLYKNQDILLFKECYAMEKIHGTSAHINFINQDINGISHLCISYFSGGEKPEKFRKLFNEEFLLRKFDSLNLPIPLTIYGEAYGGKQQGMRDTYGDTLKFVAFEVKIGEHCWLSVPKAEEIVKQLELEFIHYVKIPTEIDFIDVERDLPSVQAKRNGIVLDKKREGIVLRPLIELRKNNGARIIVKHKNDEFKETRTKRKVTDVNKLKILKEAKLIAIEWVTEMRLSHVLDKFPQADITQTGNVIKTMIEDIKRESVGEVKWSKEVERAIGKTTANMFKEMIKKYLN